MSKHTPGPWGIMWSCLPPEIDRIHCISYNAGPICGVFENWLTPGMNEANARLIAAAPDLLEALQEMLQGIEEECHEPSCAECLPWRKARAAIAKATGEST